MNPITKRYVLSSLATFITVVVATLAIQLANADAIMWTTTFWASVGITALRAGIKAVFEVLAGQKI